MKSTELALLLKKLSRLRARLSDSSAIATQQWRATTETGAEHEVTLLGAKDLSGLRDDIEGIFVWTWGLKDHVKRYAVAKGRSAGWIETEATANRAIALSADIANRLKHGGDYCRGSRSLSNPRLGEILATIPQAAIGAITVGSDWSTTMVSDPAAVTYTLPVLDGDGRVVGDAFSILDCALERWDQLITWIDAEA